MEMEVAQGPGVRRTRETPRVGVSNRKGFLRELLTDGVILTASKEVIPLDSSAQSGQEKGTGRVALRWESRSGLRGWDLVQGPGESRSALGPWGWTGGGDEVRNPRRRLGQASRGRGQGLSLGQGTRDKEGWRGQERQGWGLALGR